MIRLIEWKTIRKKEKRTFKHTIKKFNFFMELLNHLKVNLRNLKIKYGKREKLKVSNH